MLGRRRSAALRGLSRLATKHLKRKKEEKEVMKARKVGAKTGVRGRNTVVRIPNSTLMSPEGKAFEAL